MNRPDSPKAPRVVFAALAVLMTLASARFIDHLATDYALDRRASAQAVASPVQTAALPGQR